MLTDIEKIEARFRSLQDPYYKDLNTGSINVLQKVNQLAFENTSVPPKQDNIVLSDQSDQVLNYLLTQLRKIKPNIQNKPIDKIANGLYSELCKKIEEEKIHNQEMHAARGHFDNIPFHQKVAQKGMVQMQDDDMAAIMPKSTDTIAVLSVVDLGQEAIQSTKNTVIIPGIEAFIKNPELKHLMFPVGPGHWQGVYLTKPNQANGSYTVEFYDSFGAEKARLMEDVISPLLKVAFENASGNKPTFIIEIKSPKTQQRDAYSCGDFVCAYSHQKMKEWGAEPQCYNLTLINAFGGGNEHHALRKITAKYSSELNPAPNHGSSSSAITLNDEERHIFDEVQKDFLSKVKKDEKTIQQYKSHIDALIKAREEIFQKTIRPFADKDEQLAAQLQTKEFEQVLKQKDTSSTKGP